MCLLYPFTTDSEGITTHPSGQPIKFKFLRKPEPREISILLDISVSKTFNLISAKTQHLNYLKDDLRYTQVEEQLACKNIQTEIRQFEEKLKQENLQYWAISHHLRNHDGILLKNFLFGIGYLTHSKTLFKGL